MGYVVLHLDKSPGNESAMTDHIERNVIAPNVDETRTHLNKELIEFPEGVTNRTEAIKHRIENAGLSRKVGKNQVQVIRVLLSGSTDEMLKIQADGKLDKWCEDSIAWLQKEYGKENVVAATLHLDEDVPHIHASVVPIVQGERRQKKSKKESEPPKKQYKKKKTNRPRLCCDDVMTRDKLKKYQDTYAEAMAKYGLERGIEGSEARHITTSEHYRNQKVESNNLQLNIVDLLQQKETEQKALEQIKSQKNTEKLKNTAVDVGSTIMEGIGSLLGTSKVKQQQKEIEELQIDKENLIHEVNELKHDMGSMQKEHTSIVEKFKLELEKIHNLFPKLKELLRIENLCKHLGFSEELTKMILEMKPIGFKGKLYSSEYKRKFETEHSVAEVKDHPIQKDKLQFTIDGVSDTNWFRQKYREFQESIGINVKSNERNRGMRR